MTGKSTTRKRRSEEVALDEDEDDILLQIDSYLKATKKIKYSVEDKEELDEDALLGESDGEESLDDAGLADKQNDIDSADTTGLGEDEQEDTENDQQIKYSVEDEEELDEDALLGESDGEESLDDAGLADKQNDIDSADTTGPGEDEQEDTENDQQGCTVNGATCTCELELNGTKKCRSEEMALDEDDILLQEDSPTKKMKDSVEDEEELDEDALLGESDGEESLDDAGLADRQNDILDNVAGLDEGEDGAGLLVENIDSAVTTGMEVDELEEDQELLLCSRVPEIMEVAYRVNARKLFLGLKVPVGSQTAWKLESSQGRKVQIQLVSEKNTENDLGVLLYVRFPQGMSLSFSLQSSRTSNGKIMLARRGRRSR